MRFVLSLVLFAGIMTAVGCGRGKIPTKELTAEEIQQQKDAESRVKAEESEHLKTMPKEKTHEQSVEEQERNRRR